MLILDIFLLLYQEKYRKIELKFSLSQCSYDYCFFLQTICRFHGGKNHLNGIVEKNE